MDAHFDPFAKIKSEESKPWPKPIEFNAFILVPSQKPKPIIDGLLDDNSRFVIGGGSKTFKSWLMSELAICIACGAPWWIFNLHQHAILYCNFELQEFYFKRRLCAIRDDKRLSIPRNFFHLWNLRDWDISLSEFKIRLIELIRAHNILVVFIDPFYRLLGDSDERISAELAPIHTAFADVSRQTGASILCAAHFTKGNQALKDPLDRISGGASLSRFPDGLLTLTKHETEGAFTIDLTARDFPPVESFVVKWVYPSLKPCDSLDPSKIKTPSSPKTGAFTIQKLLDLIDANDDLLGTDALKDLALEQLQWSRRTFYNKLTQLKNDKLIFESKLSGKWNVKK